MSYRPSIWGANPITTITVPAQQSSTTSYGGLSPTDSGTLLVTQTVTNTPSVTYVYDGYQRTEHTLRSRITENPVQTGPATSDHITLEPRRLTITILMTDTMSSYYPGQFETGGNSRSVNAYATLKSMWNSGIPLTITTRLDTYSNMGIEDIYTVEDVDSQLGLRAVVAFREIIFADVLSQPISQRSQVTGSSGQGQLSSAPPTPVALSQHTPTTLSSVPGAGTVSSNVTGS